MRIRTIKPEFWRSDDIAALALEDRLLFIGLWSYVDDSGIGIDKVAHICADLFAADLSESPTEVLARVQGGLSRLRERGLIVRYLVDGKPYLYITNWSRHQRIDKPSKRRYPLPDEGDEAPEPDPREDSGSPRETPAPGTEEQGNRGTGDQGTNTCSPAPPSSTPSPAPADRFDEFWDAYPRKVGKQKARGKYAAACKRADPQTVIDGATRLRDDPNLPDAQFIPHPTTWLERDGWDDPPLPPRIGRETAADRNLQRGYQIAQRYAQTPQHPSLNDNPFEANTKEIRA